MSEINEHLEHAEHAGHDADPYTMRVAMSMAIIAAILATVSLIGHRKHNDNLRLIGDANRLRTEAAAHKVEASNLFAWYQSKKLRVEMTRSNATATEIFTLAPGTEEKVKKAVDDWRKYANRNDPPKKKGEQAPQPRADNHAKAPDNLAKADSHGKVERKPPETLPELEHEGKLERDLADKNQHEAEEAVHEAEHVHHQADWLDLAHLAVELGLVLCTVAILTRRKEFWFVGILAAIVGLFLAGYGMVLPH